MAADDYCRFRIDELMMILTKIIKTSKTEENGSVVRHV